MMAEPLALDERETAPRLHHAAETTFVNESLRRRESLLAATAKVSRLLLEAPSAMQVMHDVLRLLGEAAEVDRTALALSEIGPKGERWLVIKSEWVAEGVKGQGCDTGRMAWNERKSDCFCMQLQSGQSVYVCRERTPEPDGVSIASDRAKSSVIVPILVDGEYAGAIGFDDCHRARQFDPAVVSALEIAAGLIGAALHRERLVETVRRERELAAEERAAQLARANAMLRANLEQLASEPDLRNFMGRLLFEAARHVDAAQGLLIMLDDHKQEWRIVANVRDGKLEEPKFPCAVPQSVGAIRELTGLSREPVHIVLDRIESLPWPGALEHHRAEGHKSMYVLPLVFGEQQVGFLVLSFRHENPPISERAEMLITLAQQATLAIGLKRLGASAKNAAVLAERNRIGQEIHDGLAQAFTGILMQLGAVEGMDAFKEGSPLAPVLARIRDLARDGLAEARRSVMALRPDQTRRAGLELALRQLAERSTIPGRVTCVYEGTAVPTGLPPEHEHELLRIATEAVSNAVRHAQPATVRIALLEESTHWILDVVDDGCGMEQRLELYAQQGFGLTSMRERAAAIGGKWQIDSRPGEGTRVRVRVPKRAAR